MAKVVRETVISGRTSAASGTLAVATLLTLGGRALNEFKELLIYLNVTTALAGTTPTMDLYLQRAVVPNPVAATDAHWDDLYAFPQVITALIERIVHLPVSAAVVVSAATAHALTRQMAGMVADSAKLGHWGDRIRIVEKMGGTVTTAAVYSIHITGILETAE